MPKGVAHEPERVLSGRKSISPRSRAVGAKEDVDASDSLRASSAGQVLTLQRRGVAKSFRACY